MQEYMREYSLIFKEIENFFKEVSTLLDRWKKMFKGSSHFTTLESRWVFPVF
jgi:hypothetical protein